MIIPSYKPAYIYGGPIRSVSMLAESLVRQEYEVTVYTTMANGHQDLEVEPGRQYMVEGVKVHYFKRLTRGHSNFSPGLLGMLKKTAQHFDVIHIHSWWNLVTVPAAWICLSKKITPLISPRGTLTEYTFEHRRNLIKRGFHFLAGKWLLSHTALVFTTEREKREALKFVTGKKTIIKPNLLDLPQMVEGAYQETRELKIIFLGRIDPAKNLEVLIRAIKNLNEFPFRLVIAGEGESTYTRELKMQTANIPQVEWIGEVDGEDKFRLLAESDLLVLPSHTENYGNVVFEALSQGTPVAVSENVGAKEYILHHDLGWVIQGGEDAWKKTIIDIWKDKSKREAIRQRAPLTIAADFNLEKQAKEYITMYKDHIIQFGKV